MAIRSELRNELLRLSSEERQTLADELYDSLTDDVVDPAWEQAWSDEITRRVRDIVDGKAELIDSADVHAEIRAELTSDR